MSTILYFIPLLYMGFAPAGDVYVIAGQSNAAGVAQHEKLFTNGNGLQGLLYGPTWSESSWGALNNYSGWPLVANYIADHQKMSVTVIMSALGGTSITPRWQPGGDLYEALIAKVTAMRVTPKAILWWQGESDTGMTQAQYNGYLDTLANGLFAATGAKLMPCKLEYLGPGPNTVNLAIAEAWADNPHVLTGPDLSDMIPDADGVHLTTDENVAEAALRWWNAIHAALY